MDQEELRALEQRCIQEEAPECTAACPIHVDGRAFVGHVAKGEWPEAWKVLSKTMPFPGILGRICDAPCRQYCKRREAGDPIQIGDLERACVATPPPPARVLPLPRKGKTVAVIGSGLSGLSAAWDLARKGYAICIFEPGSKLGGPLRDIPGHRLPEAALEEELERLTALDVAVHLNVDVAPASFLEQCISENDAVFLSPDAAGSDPAARPRPGWSERQENRARLRASLVKKHWGERAQAMQEHERITLIIAPEVAELLEKRRILVEDVQQVIHAAEKSGRVAVHPQTSRLKASHRPYRATIWVEYSPAPDGYVVHTAYSHRIEVMGGTRT